MTPDIAVEYCVPGACSAEELTVPLELFDDCQGKQDESVTLESGKKKSTTIASWRDSGIPQLLEYEAKPVKKPFPEVPTTLLPVDAEFWPALRAAAECTDQSPSRYALHNLQLRGETGQVCAADGRQVYWHGGFQFPWTGDVLVPASGVLGCAELAGEGSVEIGKTESSLVLRIGNWTLVLTIDSVGRFPALDEIATCAEAGTSLLRLSAGDAEFLTTALPKLPRDGSDFQGVTLDLNGQAILQAQAAADAPRTDVLLSNATTAGPPIRIAMDRHYLLRALTQGFRNLRLSEPNQPLLAADERRKYIWAPLSLNEAIGQATEVIRIESPSERSSDSRNRSLPTRRKATMSAATNNPQAVAADAAATAAEPIGNAAATDIAGATNAAAGVANQVQTGGQGRRTRAQGQPPSERWTYRAGDRVARQSARVRHQVERADPLAEAPAATEPTRRDDAGFAEAVAASWLNLAQRGAVVFFPNMTAPAGGGLIRYQEIVLWIESTRVARLSDNPRIGTSSSWTCYRRSAGRRQSHFGPPPRNIAMRCPRR